MRHSPRTRRDHVDLFLLYLWPPVPLLQREPQRGNHLWSKPINANAETRRFIEKQNREYSAVSILRYIDNRHGRIDTWIYRYPCRPSRNSGGRRRRSGEDGTIARQTWHLCGVHLIEQFLELQRLPALFWLEAEARARLKMWLKVSRTAVQVRCYNKFVVWNLRPYCPRVLDSYFRGLSSVLTQYHIEINCLELRVCLVLPVT